MAIPKDRIVWKKVYGTGRNAGVKFVLKMYIPKGAIIIEPRDEYGTIPSKDGLLSPKARTNKLKTIGVFVKAANHRWIEITNREKPIVCDADTSYSFSYKHTLTKMPKTFAPFVQNMSRLRYQLNRTTTVKTISLNRNIVCTKGLHFFRTKEEACNFIG